MVDHSVFFVEPHQRKYIARDLAEYDQHLFTGRASNYCAYPECSDYALYRGTPLCREHAAHVWSIFEAREPALHQELVREQYKDLQLERKDAETEATETRRLTAQRPGYVYYVEVGDRIKIGFTENVANRMRAYPPTSTLLAVHPGTPSMEKEMHSKFRVHLAEGREWFKPSEELAAHIEAVAKQFPLELHFTPNRPTRPAPKGKSFARRV